MSNDPATDRWQMIDGVMGRCPMSVVGSLKSEPFPPSEPSPPSEPLHDPVDNEPLFAVDDLDDEDPGRSAVRILRKATMQAFNNIGGVRWLEEVAERKPETFARLLMRLLPQTIDVEATVTSVAGVPQAIRDLTLEDLRAMRPGGAVIDAEFVEVKR